jgi:AcrR family transcriptional regulator
MSDVKDRILSSTRATVLAEGYAALSMRKVAAAAGVPLSQIHYHFGSKEQLVLATLMAEDARLLHRQQALYAGDEPLSVQWRRACDYLDEDLDSGYVRILHELTAAGWSNDSVNAELRRLMDGWREVLTEGFGSAALRGVDFAPLTVEQVVALVAAAFIGAESMILSRQENAAMPVRAALRAVGDVLEAAEIRAATEVPS